MTKQTKCERCAGTGNEFLHKYRRCENCSGTGLITETVDPAQVSATIRHKCLGCASRDKMLAVLAKRIDELELQQKTTVGMLRDALIMVPDDTELDNAA